MKTLFLATLLLSILLYSCEETKAPPSNPNLVVINGKITHALNNIINVMDKDTIYTATLAEDGAFEISFELDSSQIMDLNHENEYASIYLKPGSTIHVTIDAAQFDESITYKGSPPSSFLAKKYLINEKLDLSGEVYYMSTNEEYKAFLEQYEATLNQALAKVDDSLFVAQQKKEIQTYNAQYLEGQKKLSSYSENTRKYMHKQRMMSMSIYESVEVLNVEDFKMMLVKEADSLNMLLDAIADAEYVQQQKAYLQTTTQTWIERKISLENMPKKGESAIDFSYPDHTGKEVSLSSLKGKMVFIDVWATWCGPCKAQIPALQQLEQEYHDKNITFLSVSVDTDKDKWFEMVQDMNLGGIQLWADGWSQITKDYSIWGIPRFMLIAADGTIISTDAPRPSSQEATDLIEAHL